MTGATTVQKSVRIGEIAKLLGVTRQTVRKYVSENKIPYHRTISGQLCWTEADVEEIKNKMGFVSDADTNKEKIYAFYARSSSGSKTAIESQLNLLKLSYSEAKFIIKDSGSGLNEHRKGLMKLMTLAENREITDIVITNPDRLSRFGNHYLTKYFELNGVKITSLNSKEEKSMEQELIDDFMALLASFSGRFYGIRRKENQKKLLEAATLELEKQQ